MRKTCYIISGLLLAGTAAQGVTIIGGALGNGDFNAGGNPPTAAQSFADTSNWFNADGAETLNFTQTNQLGGSTDPSAITRGGFFASGRTIVNNTGYSIVSAGEIFSLSYDFGAGGQAARWDGDETMTSFIFASPTAPDDTTASTSITQLASDVYMIDRASDGQWTTRTTPIFYTSTPADVGTTVYLGMVFDTGDLANDVAFPRTDVVNFSVEPVPEPSSALLMGLGALALCTRRKRL